MNIVEIFAQWGWVGVLLIWLTEKLWPFLADKVFPARLRQQETKQRREDEAEKYRRTVEERRIVAMENMADNVRTAMNTLSETVNTALREMSQSVSNQNQQVVLALTISNERIEKLYEAHQRHDSFTIQAVSRMNDSMRTLHPAEKPNWDELDDRTIDQILARVEEKARLKRKEAGKSE